MRGGSGSGRGRKGNWNYYVKKITFVLFKKEHLKPGSGGRSLSSRPAWSTEQVPGQSKLVQVSVWRKKKRGREGELAGRQAGWLVHTLRTKHKMTVLICST